jgi:hypothetical protein
MRERFNRGGYWDRLQQGELTAVILREGNPRPEISEKWPGCKSYLISYRDEKDNEIARVHQYGYPPTGAIVPNKRPDPKYLFEDGVLYHLVKGPKDDG